jgi:hypothetical protein
VVTHVLARLPQGVSAGSNLGSSSEINKKKQVSLGMDLSKAVEER